MLFLSVNTCSYKCSIFSSPYNISFILFVHVHKYGLMCNVDNKIIELSTQQSPH